jgi:hypothetical protein
VKTIDRPSGDQPTAPIALSSMRVTRDSRLSASERTSRSLPTRPEVIEGRTKATRDPSGETVTFDSTCSVVHTAAAGLPSIGTRHRSPFLETNRVRPSALQNAPASEAPASGSSRGAVPPSESAA